MIKRLILDDSILRRHHRDASAPQENPFEGVIVRRDPPSDSDRFTRGAWVELHSTRDTVRHDFGMLGCGAREFFRAIGARVNTHDDVSELRLCSRPFYDFKRVPNVEADQVYAALVVYTELWALKNSYEFKIEGLEVVPKPTNEPTPPD